MQVGDTIEVRLIPHPGAKEKWYLAKVESVDQKYGSVLVYLLNGTYHGRSTRVNVKVEDCRAKG